jgi:hypothetical protein
VKVGDEIYVENMAYVSLSDMLTPVIVKAIVGNHLLVDFGLGNLCNHVVLGGIRIVAATKKEFYQLAEIRLRKQMDKAEADQQHSRGVLAALKQIQKELSI